MVKKTDEKQDEKAPETTIGRLTRLVNAEEQRIGAEKNPVKRQTGLRTVVMLLAELRKAEKDARNQSDEITKADMLEAFRRMSDTEQARFVRELEQQRKKGSGLA